MVSGIASSRLEDRGSYFLGLEVLHRPSKLKYNLINIYGPADHSKTVEFLDEITGKIERCHSPVIMGGDFNLIRGSHDKNNDRINWPRVNLFNNYIADWGLHEVQRTGARFTWTNKCLNPVRCVLDRVFISASLVLSFPLCSLVAETSLGSDHTPLVLDTGEGSPIRSNHFYFETGWLALPGFDDL